MTRDLAIPNRKWAFPLAKTRLEDEDNAHRRPPEVSSFVPPEPVEDEAVSAVPTGSGLLHILFGRANYHLEQERRQTSLQAPLLS